MLDNVLKEYIQHHEYSAIQDAAKSKLKIWIEAGVEDTQFLKECNWMLDSAIFFNTRKDRAYLLLLIQDNLPQAELDYVYVMYAVLHNEEWDIYFAGLPNLVFPRSAFKGRPVSFAELSRMAKKELSHKYLDKNGRVNDEFVNGAYTDDLKQKHLKFLSKK